jgi:hypothetical protein
MGARPWCLRTQADRRRWMPFTCRNRKAFGGGHSGHMAIDHMTPPANAAAAHMVADTVRP